MKALTLSVFFLVSCQPGISQVILDCKIEGLSNDTIFIEVNSLDVTKNYDDTIVVKNGNFRYEKDIGTPTMLMIKAKSAFETMSNGLVYLPHSKRIFVLAVPNDTVKIRGELNNDAVKYFINSSVKFNSRLRDEHYAKLDKDKKTLSIQREIESQTDSQIKRNLMQEYMRAKGESRTVKMDYISKHPDDEWSAFLLIGSAVPADFIKLYDQLSSEVKNGLFKEMLDSRMLLSKQKLGIVKNELERNSIAPAFTLISISGDKVSLKDFNGKYFLLDFWGTWCVPCLNGLPKMKSYYERYSKQIQFVSIACNDRKEKVVETVKTKGLNWIQTLDDNSINVARLYKVDSYPTKVLINKDGKIVDVFVGETEAVYKRLDELFGQ